MSTFRQEHLYRLPLSVGLAASAQSSYWKTGYSCMTRRSTCIRSDVVAANIARITCNLCVAKVAVRSRSSVGQWPQQRVCMIRTGRPDPD